MSHCHVQDSFTEHEVMDSNLWTHTRSPHTLCWMGGIVLVYLLCRCGPLIDLCRGPHVRHTGKIKAMQVTKVCMSAFLGRCDAIGWSVVCFVLCTLV